MTRHIIRLVVFVALVTLLVGCNSAASPNLQKESTDPATGVMGTAEVTRVAEVVDTVESSVVTITDTPSIVSLFPTVTLAPQQIVSEEDSRLSPLLKREDQVRGTARYLDPSAIHQSTLSLRDQIYLYIDEIGDTLSLGLYARHIDPSPFQFQSILLRGNDSLLELQPTGQVVNSASESVVHGKVEEQWVEILLTSTEIEDLFLILSAPYVVLRFDGDTPTDVILSREQHQAMVTVINTFALLNSSPLRTPDIAPVQTKSELATLLLGEWRDDKYPDVQREYRQDGTLTIVTSSGSLSGTYLLPSDGEIVITPQDEQMNLPPMHRNIQIVNNKMLLTPLPDEDSDEFWSFTRVLE